MGIKNTGIWEQDIADTGHIFSYYLARWIAKYLPTEYIVYDFGCGLGTYCQYLTDRGFKKVVGAEGYPLNNFEYDKILIQDISKPFHFGRGNVMCLEVIEHIPLEFSEIVFDNICGHVLEGCKAIISCAVPEQGGDGHINCHPNEWVIEHMTKRGLKYLQQDTQSARNVIENHCAYFRETLLIFEK